MAVVYRGMGVPPMLVSLGQQKEKIGNALLRHASFDFVDKSLPSSSGTQLPQMGFMAISTLGR